MVCEGIYCTRLKPITNYKTQVPISETCEDQSKGRYERGEAEEVQFLIAD